MIKLIGLTRPESYFHEPKANNAIRNGRLFIDLDCAVSRVSMGIVFFQPVATQISLKKRMYIVHTTYPFEM